MSDILKGMNIIAKYEPDSAFRAEHDEIWFGDYRTTYDKMTPAERVEMDTLGWCEDEESWQHWA